MIVDFVPFGYDVDKLLLRLLETWDSVDVYVIYETAFYFTTHTVGYLIGRRHYW
jgi:hypothetical protein